MRWLRRSGPGSWTPGASETFAPQRWNSEAVSPCTIIANPGGRLRLFRTKEGVFAEKDGQHFHAEGHTLDELLSHDDLPEFLTKLIADAKPAINLAYGEILAPI